MIEVTLGQLLDSVDALRKLNDADIEALVSYDVAMIIEQVDNRINIFIKTQREIALRHGKPSKDDPSRIEFEDGGDKYNRELGDLLAKKVKIDAEPVPLESISRAVLKPREIATLRWMLHRGEHGRRTQDDDHGPGQEARRTSGRAKAVSRNGGEA